MKTIIKWLLLICIISSAGWFGRVIPFAEQWPLYEALRTTAAIIFAVVGAWMAIIYPERLKMSFRSSVNLKTDSSAGLGKLFSPVINSTVILSIILVIGVTAPLLKRATLPVEIELVRGLSYAILISLTLLQLWTVILTLIPASVIKEYADDQDEKTRVLNELSKLE